jgi:preprotein translocase subunit SecD
MGRFGWVPALLSGVVFCFCGCKQESSLTVPAGGVGFLFQLEGGGDRADQLHKAQESMVDAIRHRLSRLGLLQEQVLAEGPDKLKVLVPNVNQATAEKIEQVLTRPTQLSIAFVEDGKDFFASLKDQLPKDSKVAAASDRYDLGANVPAEEGWYLMSSERQSLEAFVKTLTLPKGRRLAVLPGFKGALAYLLVEPPALENPVLQKIRVVASEDPADTAVEAELAEPFRSSFAELTQKALHHRIAILIDSEIVSLPVVESSIQNGRLRISPSPVPSPDTLPLQAKMLAEDLNAWSLVKGLRLIKKEFTPAP